MGSTLKAQFDSRRDAEVAVERLVQELKIERTDIFITPVDAGNSAGTTAAGADVESGHEGVEKHGDPALGGRIEVSVDLPDDGKADDVRRAFAEFDGSAVDKE